MKKIATIATICILSTVSAQAVNKKALVTALKSSASGPASVVKTFVGSEKTAQGVADIVTTAIKSTKASPTQVSLIVQAAIKAKPRYANVIVFAALAAAPKAYNEIKFAYLARAPKGPNGESPVWREVNSSGRQNPMNFPQVVSKNGKNPRAGVNGGDPLFPILSVIVVEVPAAITPNQ